MIRKGILTSAIGFIFVVSVASAETQISIGASGSGSGPYLNGALMAETANKEQKEYDFSVQITGGYKDNLGLVLTDKVHLALNTLIGINFAYNQRGSYADSPMKEDFKRLRYVFTFGAVPQNIFVREDSGISKLEDIKGKSFNINIPSSFTHGMNLNMLKAAQISLDSFNVGKVPTGQVFEQIQNGVFDGGAHVYQLGLGNAQRLSSTISIKYLDVPTSVIESMNDMYHGLLVPFEIPANTYNGQTKSITTFGLAQVIFTDENADEEMIYQFTKSFWTNIAKLQESNTSFSGMTPQLGATLYGIPMHPGAQRYFEEVGAM